MNKKFRSGSEYPQAGSSVNLRMSTAYGTNGRAHGRVYSELRTSHFVCIFFSCVKAKPRYWLYIVVTRSGDDTDRN